jgi:ribonuclease HII
MQDETERLLQMSEYENRARAAGFSAIAGIDEAGRGPLAGPVVAAAVILPEACFLYGLNDSKKLTPKARERLYEQITQNAVAWGTGSAEPDEIDEINILNAAKRSMARAVAALDLRPDCLLIDAITIPGISIPQYPIIKGDALSVSIAAASVVAKVTRDRIMEAYDARYPEYGFAKHKGYGTREHYAALVKYGASPIHRLSFRLS